MLELVTIPTTDIAKIDQSKMNGENIGLDPYSLGVTSFFNILAVLSYHCQDPLLIITVIVPII